jgi:hypothetical protein
MLKSIIYLHEDSGKSKKDVDDLLISLKLGYRTLRKREGRNFPERLSHLSKCVSTEWDPKIIELLISRLEYEVKSGIFLKFFSITVASFIIFLGSGQIYQNTNNRQNHSFEKIERKIEGFNIQFFASGFFALITAWFFLIPNIERTQFLLILRYALIIKRYPEDAQIQIKNQVQHLD